MKSIQVVLTILGVLNLSTVSGLSTQHVAPLAELQGELVAKSVKRSENIQEIQRLLHHDLVRKQLGDLVALEKVEIAVAKLDDEALTLLAEQTRQVNARLQAGRSTAANVVIIAAAVAAFFLILVLINQ